MKSAAKQKPLTVGSPEKTASDPRLATLTARPGTLALVDKHAPIRYALFPVQGYEAQGGNFGSSTSRD